MIRAPASSGPGDLPPALVASPRLPDSAVLEQALIECGIPARPVLDPAELAELVMDAGCVVLTQEMLTPEFRDAVAAMLDGQPAWSEVPFVVILETRNHGIAWKDVLLARWTGAQVTILVRPLGGLQFQSAVQLAISARIRQFRIRDQLRQEEELRRELNHRVKNILASVQAIANMTRYTSQGEDMFGVFGDRLAALGRVHGALYRVGNEGETFETLTRTVLAPYLADAERFEINGPADPLEPEACNSLGLCLFELATNASKHGALSGERGAVSVRLTKGAGTARLIWRETGGPVVPTQPTRMGYGTRFLLLTLASLFGSEPTLDFDADGFRLTVEGRPHGLFFDPGSK